MARTRGSVSTISPPGVGMLWARAGHAPPIVRAAITVDLSIRSSMIPPHAECINLDRLLLILPLPHPGQTTRRAVNRQKPCLRLLPRSVEVPADPYRRHG